MTEVPAEPALVVATPGAEPRVSGGYGAALLLDGWALLGRQDLRAAEDALRRWMAAAALVRDRDDGGLVAVVAESAIPTVQALIRWDPVAHAESELESRAEVGLPPAVHLAAIDGNPVAVADFLEAAGTARRRGCDGARRPAVGGPTPVRQHRRRRVSRMLVRVPRNEGLGLAAALRRATRVLSARRDQQPVRIQIDPLHIG